MFAVSPYLTRLGGSKSFLPSPPQVAQSPRPFFQSPLMQLFSPPKSFFLRESLVEGNAKIDFKSLKLIGSGGQAKIYEASVEISNPRTRQIEKMRCALKRIFHPRVLPSQRVQRTPDFQTYKAIVEGSDTEKGSGRSRDNFILALLDIVEHRGATYAVLPLCRTFLDKELPSFYALTEQPLLFAASTLRILNNMLVALSFLHEKRNYLHADMKIDNIALYEGEWILIDFDSASYIDSSKIPDSNMFFKHPAALFNISLSTQSYNDIFALGIILKILLDSDYLATAAGKGQVHYCREMEKAYSDAQKHPIKLRQCTAQEMKDDPLAALRTMANIMTCLNEKEIPSAAELLITVQEFNKVLLDDNPWLTEAVSEFLLAKEHPGRASRSAGFFAAPANTFSPTTSVVAPVPG